MNTIVTAKNITNQNPMSVKSKEGEGDTLENSETEKEGTKSITKEIVRIKEEKTKELKE